MDVPNSKFAPLAAPIRRFGADTASGAHSAVKVVLPFMKRNATRIGDWLASIGWGKFFLLSLLALILTAALASFVQRRSAIVIDTSDVVDAVRVDVSVSPSGIIIAPPKPPTPPTPPEPHAVPKVAAESVEPSMSSPKDLGLKVNEKSVRIVKERDGKPYAVIIDDKGIHIKESRDPVLKELPTGAAENLQEARRVIEQPKGDIEQSVQEVRQSARTAESDKNALTVSTELNDPDRVAEAIESARTKIEDIVSDQVRRQVARRIQQSEEDGGDWMMSFVFLLIIAAVIVKIVLGSKKKAEYRAQAATMTAAEEGLKRQLAEAQLKMMQAQVEPHFLFNTLASVDYLIETDPARASMMQKNLIQYLRAALPQMREGSTTLGKEVALCRAYLEILKVRMDDRLQFAITVPQGLASAQFPPMMMQSLVENAIKHGLEPKAEGGAVTITANVANGNLCVTVADTGLGFGAGSQPGTSVGLANVRERLLALYGARAKLSIEANTLTGTIATIEVPYTYDAAATSPASPSGDPGGIAQPA